MNYKWIQSESKCLADLCGALHCDFTMDSYSKFRKTKCNPAAAARNHHLCEVLFFFCEQFSCLILIQFFDFFFVCVFISSVLVAESC